MKRSVSYSPENTVTSQRKITPKSRDQKVKQYQQQNQKCINNTINAFHTFNASNNSLSKLEQQFSFFRLQSPYQDNQKQPITVSVIYQFPESQYQDPDSAPHPVERIRSSQPSLSNNYLSDTDILVVRLQKEAQTVRIKMYQACPAHGVANKDGTRGDRYDLLNSNVFMYQYRLQGNCCFYQKERNERTHLNHIQKQILLKSANLSIPKAKVNQN